MPTTTTIKLVKDWLQRLETTTSVSTPASTPAAASAAAAVPTTRTTLSKKRRVSDQNDHDFTIIGMASPPRSASPTKRRRIENDQEEDHDNDNIGNEQDAAVTPRPLRRSTASVGYSGPWSETSSSAAPQSSGRSSPVKKERAMRQTTDIPLSRKPIQHLKEEEERLPALVALVARLVGYRDKVGILPRTLEGHIRSQAAIDETIRDWMFTPQPPESTTTAAAAAATFAAASMLTAAGPVPMAIFRDYAEYHRIQEICEATRNCADAGHRVHEAEWNDKVHSPILELVLAGTRNSSRPLVQHNITNVRVDRRFRDQEQALGDNKIDYGVFLAPPGGSELGQSIASHQRGQACRGNADPQLHALHGFEPDRPLGLSIETKRNRGGDANGPSQLAMCTRAHFRAVLDTLGGPSSSSYADDIVHPLIDLQGTTWHASFAVRRGNSMTIYGDIRLGSTETPTDCYALLAGLRCLCDWIRDDHWDWWTARLQEPNATGT